LYESEPGTALNKFTSLAEEPKIDESVRLGDIYSILILHNVKRTNFKKAYQLLQQYQTKKTGTNITEFISTSIVDQVCDEVGAPRMTRAAKQDDIQDEDTIEFRLLLNNW
jgi:intraflagellar transport protein 140